MRSLYLIKFNDTVGLVSAISKILIVYRKIWYATGERSVAHSFRVHGTLRTHQLQRRKDFRPQKNRLGLKTFISSPLLSLTPSHDRMPLKLEGCCSVLHIFVVQLARTQRHMPMGTIQHHWCWWGMLISIWNNKRYIYAPEGRYCGFSYPHNSCQHGKNSVISRTLILRSCNIH